MKRIRSFVSFLLCLCLLLLCTGNAFAADLSRKNCELNKMKSCTVTALTTNQYTEGRPLIVFFLGSQECFSWLNSITFIRDQKIFSELDVDIVFVTLPKAEMRYTLWDPACKETCAFLSKKYEAAHFPIIIDAVSFGGYGGCLLTGLLRENSIPVQELNLADACNSNCVYADWIREIALAGTRVNIWGTEGTQNISRNTREVIAEVDGTENIMTIVLECHHAKALNKAILEHGLHSDLPRIRDEQ